MYPYRSVDPDPEEGTESVEAKSSGYADIDNFMSNENKPPPEKDRVIYDDIQGYNNPEVCYSIRKKLLFIQITIGHGIHNVM